MFNPFLRMQNIFQPEQLVGQQQQPLPTDFYNPPAQPEGFGGLNNLPNFNPSPPIAEDPRGQAPPQSMFDRIMGMNQPKDRYTRMLEEHLNQYPQPKKPGFWSKVAASIIGLGYGPEGAGRFLDEPYNEDVQTWKNKLQPLEALTRDENQDNTYQRMMINQALIGQIRTDESAGKLANWESLAKSRETRNQINWYKANHPNARIIAVRGGNYMAYDNVNGLKDLGIKTGTMTREDELETIHDYDMSEIGARGANSWDNAVVAGARYFKDPETGEMRVFNPRNDEIPPPGWIPVSTGSGEDEESEMNKQRGLFSKAMEARNTHPEWRRYIRFGPNANQFEIVKPSSWFGREKDKQTYNEMIEFIYWGGGSAKSSPRTTTPKPSVNPKTPPVTPTPTTSKIPGQGKVIEYDASGRRKN